MSASVSEMLVRKLNLCLVLLIVVCVWVPVVMAEENSLLCTCYGEARIAEPQYNLPNCSWYKNLACCLRTEVTSVLGSMYMIHSSTKACRARLNYMMCYFCSPDQHKWYDKGKVNICSSFCNDTFEECKTTMLEDLAIGDMFKSGTEFCEANSFEIVPGKDHCFDFDPTVFSGSDRMSLCHLLVMILSLFCWVCVALF
ncbi:hypothetical protein HOLleu_38783 [Holothuria leucospilota]|uniref:Folate receptor-like domain-containing protein n=1 Tax=Holothuria leucospilota TaxID=206669 RepID=A0A9Q1BED2_HOLLE|nr:hypothetical protein HOLleu_38783 [Holothuria leucospilota]